MKPYSFLMCISLVAALSCKQKTNELDTAAVMEDTSRLSLEDVNRYSEMVDSSVFHIGPYEFELGTSKKANFESLQDPFKTIDTSETKRLKPYASIVTRKGDTLLFRSTQSKITSIVNNTDSESDDFSSYEFLMDMPEINQWLVKAFYYESYGYLFIDKTTGERIDLFGMPAVSPNHQYIITFNQDLEANFTFNGFQLLEYKDSKLKLIDSKELYTWGPDNVLWKDNTTMLIQQSKSHYTDDVQEIESDYVQLKMK